MVSCQELADTRLLSRGRARSAARRWMNAADGAPEGGACRSSFAQFARAPVVRAIFRNDPRRPARHLPLTRQRGSKA